MTVSLSLFMLVFAKRSPSEFLLIKTQKIHTHPLFLLITTVIKESKAIRLDDQLARSQFTLILKVISFISRVFIYLAFVSCAWRVNANYVLRSPTSIAIQETISAMLLYRCIFIRPREYYCWHVVIIDQFLLYSHISSTGNPILIFSILKQVRRWSDHILKSMNLVYGSCCSRRCRSYGGFSFRGGKSRGVVESSVWGGEGWWVLLWSYYIFDYTSKIILFRRNGWNKQYVYR